MSLGLAVALGIALLAGGLILVEVVNFFLAAGARSVGEHLEAKRKKPERRFPWNDRTGT